MRYPGGKASFAPLISTLCGDMSRDTFTEAYAGGAGLGLTLLAQGKIDHLVLNDLNPGIANLHQVCFTNPDTLIEFIMSTPLDLDTWQWAHDLYTVIDGTADPVAQGLATFFLNRTNHSGILSGRPIGGLAQTGAYPLGCRFNRENLASRVRYLGALSHRVTVTCREAATCILDTASGVIYADPPYRVAGAALYRGSCDDMALVTLRAALEDRGLTWCLSHDEDPVAEHIFNSYRVHQVDHAHHANGSKRGRELLWTSQL